MSKENPNELKIINKNERLKYQKLLYTYKQQIADLEAKLAESENKVKGFVELFDKKQHENYEQFCEIMQLKQQLAEKDQAIESLQEINQSLGHTCNNDAKEIERLREQLTEEKNRNKKLNHEAQKYYEDAYCNGFQNQKAIAELEKAKKLLVEKMKLASDKLDCAYYIDNQIKELRGEENE